MSIPIGKRKLTFKNVEWKVPKDVITDEAVALEVIAGNKLSYEDWLKINGITEEDFLPPKKVTKVAKKKKKDHPDWW